MDATERQVVPTDGDEDAELDLLIDLLADSSGSSPKSTSHGLSHESASKDAAIVFEGLRQSTPIPRRYSSAAPATPFSPDAHEEFLPQVPPMAPHIPAVRSVTHLSNPSPLGAAALTTPRGFPVPVASVVTDIPAHHTSSGRNPPPQTTFRIPMAALHAINPELLPVSPFLLSPTLATGTLPGQNVSTIARDGSRSPFFVQLSPTSSPPIRMRSLSQASIEATRDPNTLLSPPNIQVRGSTHHLAMSVGSRVSTIDQLAMDLEYARAELSAAHQECERLRQLVQDHLEPNDSPGERIKPGVNIPSESQLPQEGVQKEALVLERQESLTAALSTQVEAPSTPQRSRSPFVRPENSPPLIKDIESLTERQAKDKLSVCIGPLS
ncbi:hypothetical protein DL93DRAFT_839949 [Clavulina sp. PMI_390]|nr:hypothetical protein DL93DRAFT_839949 [Clavulina sp. PMI_390]